MEARRRKHKGVTAARYIRTAVPTMLRSARREPTLTLHLPDREPVAGVHFVFVSNSSPWTYANTRPVYTNPDCSFETGLGVFGTTSMNVWRNLGLVRRMLSKRADIKAGHLVRADDVAWLKVISATRRSPPRSTGITSGCAKRWCSGPYRRPWASSPLRQKPPDLRRLNRLG